MKLKEELNKKIVPAVDKLNKIDNEIGKLYDLFEDEAEELTQYSGTINEINILDSIASLLDIITNEICLCRDKIEWFIKENGGNVK